MTLTPEERAREIADRIARAIDGEHPFSDPIDRASDAFIGTRAGIIRNSERAGEEVSGEILIRRSLQAAFDAYLREDDNAAVTAITAALLAERQAENEACEKVCAQIATNAERRWAGYADDEVEAKRAALDKLEAAHQCTLAIRARRLAT